MRATLISAIFVLMSALVTFNLMAQHRPDRPTHRPDRPHRPHHRPHRPHHRPRPHHGGHHRPRPHHRPHRPHRPHYRPRPHHYYPRPHYPRPHYVTRACYVDRVDHFGRLLQTYARSASAYGHYAAQEEACRMARRRCRLDRAYDQSCVIRTPYL